MTTIEFNKTCSHNKLSSYMEVLDINVEGNNMLIKPFHAAGVILIYHTPQTEDAIHTQMSYCCQLLVSIIKISPQLLAVKGEAL